MQDIGDKAVGRALRDRIIEMQYEQYIDAERLKLARLDAERCQAEGFAFLTKMSARMRLEGQDAETATIGTCDVTRRGDDMLMTTMQAIEIAKATTVPLSASETPEK